MDVQCLDWLEKAVDEQDTPIYNFHADNSTDPLHSHTRCKAGPRKMKLEP